MKEIKFEDLKEGVKLYNLVYWGGFLCFKNERELRSATIKKNTGKSVSFIDKGWRVTKKEFGDHWFTSKKECYEEALNRHEKELYHFKKNVKVFSEEVTYLKKKILIEKEKKQ